MMIVDVTHNHPVMRTFIDLLQQQRDRQLSSERGQLELLIDIHSVGSVTQNKTFEIVREHELVLFNWFIFSTTLVRILG